MSKKRRRMLIAAAALLVVGTLLFFAQRGVGALVVDMARARVRALMVAAINQAVQDILSKDDGYRDLVAPVQDDQGQLIMLRADAMRMNELATAATLATQERLNDIGAQGVAVPLGSALGGRILSGYGPNVRVRIVPVGSVTAEFSSEFEDTGINQTRHKIFLNVCARVNIVIPRQAGAVEVEAPVLIAENIIVGRVPEYYLRADDGEKTLDLVP